MPRIPRTEQSVSYEPKPQPFSSGEGYEAPGRAMQTLGRGIASLGEAFNAYAQVQDKEAEYDDKLKQASAWNAFDRSYNELRESYTGDGSDWENKVGELKAQHVDPVVGQMRSRTMQRAAPLINEQQWGSRYEAAQRYGSHLRLGTRLNNAQGLISDQAARVDFTADEAALEKQAIEYAIATNGIIDQLPGASPEQREALRKHMAASVVNRILKYQEEKGAIVGPKIDAIMRGLEKARPPEPEVGPQSSLPDLGIRDFTSKPGRGFAKLDRPTHIVLHDVSGNDPERKRLPSGGNIPNYHITFDKNGINLEVPFDRQAPHAMSFNKHSIGISHIGYEGDQLDPQAIKNGAKAVLMVQEKFGIPAQNILTHPEGGSRATGSGGKDPREAAWRKDVLAYIDANRPALLAELKGGGTQTAQQTAGGTTAKAVSTTGIDFIKKEEGWKPQAYADGRQTSVGWGTRGKPGERIDEAEGERRLQAELSEANAAIDKHVKSPLSQQQRDALVSYVFNAGPNGAARNVFEAINSGDLKKAADLMKADDKDGVVANRRSREVAMFLSGGQQTAVGAPTREELKGRSLTAVAGVQQSTPDTAARDANTIPGNDNAPTDGKLTRIADVGGGAARTTVAQAVTTPRARYGAEQELREALMKARPAIANMDRQRVTAEFKAVEDKIAAGFQLDQPTLQRLDGLSKSIGDQNLQARVLEMAETQNMVTFVQRASWEQTIEAQAKMWEALKGRIPTDREKRQFDIIDKLIKEKKNQLTDDMVGYAQRNGDPTMPVPPLDIANLTPGALDQRLAVAVALQQRNRFGVNGDDIQYFSKEEREAIEKSVKSGADMSTFVSRIASRWGPDHTVQAMHELFKGTELKEAAIAGYIGTFNPKVADELFRGLKGRQDPNWAKERSIPSTKVEATAKTVLGDAYDNFDPQVKQGVLNAATLLYQMRNKNWAEKNFVDDEILTRSIRDVIGETIDPAAKKSYGGVIEQKAPKLPGAWTTIGDPKPRDIILPPNWRNDTFREALERVTPEMLAAAGHPVAYYSDGRPVPMPRLANATLIQSELGPGKYYVSLGNPQIPGKENMAVAGETVQRDPATGETQVVPKPGRRPLFLLDLNKIAPQLSKLYPDYFARN